MRDCLKVIRIDAISDTAKMVYTHPFGNFSDLEFVGYSVRVFCLAVIVGLEMSVAVFLQRTRPQPATIGAVDHFPKSNTPVGSFLSHPDIIVSVEP